MEKDELYRMIDEREGFVSLAFPTLMRKVYLWMAFALVITGIVAFGVANTPSLAYMIFGSKVAFWGIIIAEFALVWYISARIGSLSLSTATVLFVLYSALNGAVLSIIFFAYSTTVITKVFLITAGTFSIMAFIGYQTKSDLTSLGKMLFMALIGLIVATGVNLFMHSSTMDMLICYAGVIIFVGLTAYDSHTIKGMLAECADDGEDAQKLAILGSLTLYLDFINLFLYLLRIFGGRSND